MNIYENVDGSQTVRSPSCYDFASLHLHDLIDSAKVVAPHAPFCKYVKVRKPLLWPQLLDQSTNNRQQVNYRTSLIRRFPAHLPYISARPCTQLLPVGETLHSGRSALQVRELAGNSDSQLSYLLTVSCRIF